MLRMLCLLLVLLVPVASVADDGGALTSAKRVGLVAEGPDGLVQPVGDVDRLTAELVARVNAGRLAAYRQIAATTGAPLAAVQAQAAERLKQTPPQP